MELLKKLEILADAAKYDASCASSGTRRRHSLDGKGVGSSEGSGICHAYAPDGRCISLLKILLTNFCVYECSYCINRNSSNVARARFTVDDVVRLTLDFYKRKGRLTPGRKAEAGWQQFLYRVLVARLYPVDPGRQE